MPESNIDSICNPDADALNKALRLHVSRARTLLLMTQLVAITSGFSMPRLEDCECDICTYERTH
jgi:hypothetical protein